MTETIITVRGEHTQSYPPDIATLTLNVNLDGSERSKVFDQASRVAEDLRTRITALHNGDHGPIIRWSSGTVSVWGDRPWNSDGKRLPLVFHAVIGFTATFNDFEALARFIEAAAETHGVSVGQLTWELTRENLRAATNEVRSLAVQDAVAKATAYAKTIGLDSVTATALADSGMLDSAPSAPGGGYALASARGLVAKGAGEPELSVKPEDIQVSAVVDARFVATAG